MTAGTIKFATNSKKKVIAKTAATASRPRTTTMTIVPPIAAFPAWEKSEAKPPEQKARTIEPSKIRSVK